MKKQHLRILLLLILSISFSKSYAYDIAVANADGEIIYYNIINDGSELEVTYNTTSYNSYYGSIIIPENVTYMGYTRKVTSIGYNAFYKCFGLSSVSISNNVINIGPDAFRECSGLTSVIIPNSVNSIGNSAFRDCTSLTSVTIGNNVTTIGGYAFWNCHALTTVSIGNNVRTIGERAFLNCTSLISISIPNSVTSIGDYAFTYCGSLTSIVIPNSVTSIGSGAFQEISFNTVTSLIMEPFVINTNTFSDYTFDNVTLNVPDGTVEKYKDTYGWKKFSLIKGIVGPGTEKCAKPTISYCQGELQFACATDGVTFLSSIANSDINSYNSNTVSLTVTYNVSVYATKSGMENSDIAHATLCWIDKEPTINTDISNAVEFKATPVLIQSEGGLLTIQGAEDGTPVSVYTSTGIQTASSICMGDAAHISTNLQAGSIAIVKIGNKSIKVFIR